MARGVQRLNDGLPVCLDSFIGRESELAQLSHAISTTRLLTLTGPAGVGKSRLAIELVRCVRKWYSGGVIWIEAMNLASVVAHGALSSQNRGSDTGTEKDRFGTLRGGRNQLVILDNCERAPVEVDRVVYDLLCKAPEMTVLATSQAALCLRGEVAWAVPPMEVWVDESGASPAIQLFINRAAAVTGYKPNSKSDLLLVEEICREVNGIPLAVEVAASQMRNMRVADVLQLTKSPAFLDLPLPRDHDQFGSLREIKRSSYESLPTAQQLAFRSLAVFPGSFDLSAAEAVISHEHSAPRAANMVNELAKRSLLKRVDSSGDASARYEVYQLDRRSIAAFVSSEERDRANGCHAHHFLSLAEGVAPFLDGPNAAVWIAKLQGENHNFVNALQLLLKRDPPAALRLAIALGPYHATLNQFATGEGLLASALASADGEQLLRAKAKYWVGYPAMFQRHDAAAQASFRAALRSALIGAERR